MYALAVEHAIPDPSASPHGQEVRLEVEDRLRRSGYLVLRDVSCDVRDGVLTLDGQLPSHYLKQVAQYLAYEAAGGCFVVNRIEVIASGRIVPTAGDQATTHSDGVN